MLLVPRTLATAAKAAVLRRKSRLLSSIGGSSMFSISKYSLAAGRERCGRAGTPEEMPCSFVIY